MLMDSSILPSVICAHVLNTKDNISEDCFMHFVWELSVVSSIVFFLNENTFYFIIAYKIGTNKMYY